MIETSGALEAVRLEAKQMVEKDWPAFSRALPYVAAQDHAPRLADDAARSALGDVRNSSCGSKERGATGPSPWLASPWLSGGSQARARRVEGEGEVRLRNGPAGSYPSRWFGEPAFA
ncbi:MAG: hypothetical protein MZV70_19690 [Desulfobacterales bacterium]|nr:hypothetical protein [Desulfobacterales bacterium]